MSMGLFSLLIVTYPPKIGFINKSPKNNATTPPPPHTCTHLTHQHILTLSPHVRVRSDSEGGGVEWEERGRGRGHHEAAATPLTQQGRAMNWKRDSQQCIQSLTEADKHTQRE